MRSSSTSSAMRLSRSANTLYAIVPRWLALARRVPRRPRGRRRTCGSQERLRWQAALARGCQGPWRWRVALARVAPGAYAPVRDAPASPYLRGPPSLSLRSQRRLHWRALEDRCGGLAFARSPHSLSCVPTRCATDGLAAVRWSSGFPL